MSDELWWSLLSESVDVEEDLPSFEPPPQDPESFDEHVERLLDSLDEDVQFPASLDGSPPSYHYSTPPLVSTSGSTYTTDSSEDPATSEYSSMTYSTTSNYPSPFDILDVDFGSEYNDVDPKHISVYDPSAFFDSFGLPLLSPAFSPHVQVAKAQSDDGPYRLSFGVSPHSLSIPSQDSLPADPDTTVYAASMQQARNPPNPDEGSAQIHTSAIRAKYICPECGHREYLYFSIFLYTHFFLASARKHNLKTHMDTHNPNRKKPFVCPESDCAHPFTRRHDLKRHLESMHGHPEK